MAKRITEEMKIKINELYLELGVQKKVAEVLGISTSSVSKYLIPNYKKKRKRMSIFLFRHHEVVITS